MLRVRRPRADSRLVAADRQSAAHRTLRQLRLCQVRQYEIASVGAFAAILVAAPAAAASIIVVLVRRPIRRLHPRLDRLFIVPLIV